MRPQVNMMGRAAGLRAGPAGGTAAPWAMVSTRAGSTSNEVHRRSRAASDMTTTRSARATASISTSRWCGVGSRKMVWAITMDGTRRFGQDFEHFVTVGPAEEAVFVLDHRDIALVEQLGAGRHRGRRAVLQLADHPLATSPVSHRPPGRRRPRRRWLDSPSDSAVVKVARPHAVGG